MAATLNDAWNELNERQQAYLLAVYAVDQEQETYERGAWRRGDRARKADEWRWMLFATIGIPPSDTALKQRLRDQQLVDQGTGSTFESLERRQFIECRYERASEEPMLYVKLTPRGRKLVRHVQGEQTPKRLPVGTLTAWQWEALVELYQAGDDGLPYDGRRGAYGQASWNTWLRLRDYQPYALMRERGLRSSRAYITKYGRAFYVEHYDHYRRLYPGINAAAPTGTPPKPLPLPPFPTPPCITQTIMSHASLHNYAAAHDDKPNVGTVVTQLDPAPKAARGKHQMLVGAWRRAHPDLQLGMVYGVHATWHPYERRIIALGHGTMLVVRDNVRERFYWWSISGDVDAHLVRPAMLRDWDGDQPQHQIRIADLCWFTYRAGQRVEQLDRDALVHAIERRLRDEYERQAVRWK